MKNPRISVHIDFHTMPNINDFKSGADAALIAETLYRAGVESVNLFLQCNQGFSYFPTKVGTPYPYMKGDLFGSLLKELKKEGFWFLHI